MIAETTVAQSLTNILSDELVLSGQLWQSKGED
jgi:hypothetical protein